MNKHALVAIGILVAIGVPHIAHAQSFVYAHPTGLVAATFTLSTSQWAAAPEFPPDPNGSIYPTTPAGFPLGDYRIIANLNQRYRVVAGPWLGSAALTFSRFSMDTTILGNPARPDQVEFDWFYASTPTSATGSATTAIFTPSAAGTDSMMFPGTIFRVRTNPDATRTPTQEHESWGFQTSSLVVWPRSTLGNTTLATYNAYDNVVSMLMPTDDTMDAAVFHADAGTAITLAAWLPDSTATGLILWTRCGAYPDAFNYFTKTLLTSTPSFVELGATCSTNYYVTITNTSATARVVRMLVSGHAATRHVSNQRVGVTHVMTPAEEATLTTYLRQLTWNFFAFTEGNWLFSSYNVFRNVPCSGGAMATACGGGQCDICLLQTADMCPCPSGHRACDPSPGGIMMCDGADPLTLTHESGHARLGLGGAWDEYSAFGNTSFSTCEHSFMGTGISSGFTLCGPQTHRATTTDNVPTSTPPARSIHGVFVYQPDGTVVYSPNSTDGWTTAYSLGNVSWPMPSGQGPNTNFLFQFRPLTSVGVYFF